MAIRKPSYWVPNKMQIETRGGEKLSVLLFTNKVLWGHLRGTGSAMLGLHLLSLTAPPRALLLLSLQASKLFLEST